MIVNYSESDKIIICGKFCKYPDDSNKFKVNDAFPKNEIEDNNNKDCPLYFGDSSEDKTVYFINSKLNPYTMNENLSKQGIQLYSFCVFMFIEIDSIHYKCVALTKSPSFSIISSRKNRIRYKTPLKNQTPPPKEEKEEKNLLYIPQFTPVVNEKEEEDSYKFKYTDLMPHIDEDYVLHSKKEEEERKRNRKEIDKSMFSFKSMEEAMEDVYKSLPNTIYKKSSFQMKIIDHIKGDANRQEISYNGLLLEKMFSTYTDQFYLDKYGNKCMYKPVINDSVES